MQSISPTNIDALYMADGEGTGRFLVERNGHFLFLETKVPGEGMPEGQRRMLTELSRLPRVTVLVVIGPKGYPEKFIEVRCGIWGDEQATNRAHFQQMVNAWFASVNRVPVKLLLGRDRLRPCIACNSTLQTVDVVLCLACSGWIGRRGA